MLWTLIQSARYAGDGVMVVFNDPVPVENPALQAVLMALEMRDAIGALTEKWRRLGHDIGFGIGIAHGFATLGTIGFEGRFDYAAIGTVCVFDHGLRAGIPIAGGGYGAGRPGRTGETDRGNQGGRLQSGPSSRGNAA